jgi:RNase adaptor protein for sRNA GlmZ degradation
MRSNPALRAALVFAWATDAVLQRRFTETRRRHPLSPHGRVMDGIAAEQLLTGPMRDAADLVMDTTEMSLAALRQQVGHAFGPDGDEPASQLLSLSLVSFAYPAGLPREADMVFDARFLRNPHYVVDLRPRTGQDPEVAAYVAADPDFMAFFERMADLLRLVLPRFVQEGKKYATIAIGCTGGRHRSVMLVEKLARHISHADFARPDLAQPDQAQPDQARPDPAQPTLASPTLASPTLASPTLASPTLASPTLPQSTLASSPLAGPKWRISVTHRELAAEAARAAAQLAAATATRQNAAPRDATPPDAAPPDATRPDPDPSPDPLPEP